jgi:hypothetical protein
VRGVECRHFFHALVAIEVADTPREAALRAGDDFKNAVTCFSVGPTQIPGVSSNASRIPTGSASAPRSR